MKDFDVLVIGGGLLGCFAARNLCRWKLHIALLEAREDVCTGISRANTAIVYPGYDHKPGTRKAEMCLRANAGFDALCRELDVPFHRCGSLMVSFGERADEVLRKKYENGRSMGVPGLRLLTGEEAAAMEPGLAAGVTAALYAPGAGTVNPWQLGIAACENAAANGAALCLNTRVLGIRRTAEGYRIETDRETFSCRAVINCAGLHADRVQELLFPASVRIAPDAADYLILDKATENEPTHIIQYEPENDDKGFNAVPTLEGSLLLGPSERENEVDTAVSAEGLSFVREQAGRVLPGLDLKDTIRSFAAVRPNPQRADGSSIGSFVIENPGPGFWSLIGIKTPGLTCANELGRYVAERVAAALCAEENTAFDPRRPGIRRVRGLALSRRAALVRENADYGEILCRCEDVTKAEVLEAIRRGAVSVDGVKRRVGTGMGRCQGSRCERAVMELLAEMLSIPVTAVRKDGVGSEILKGGHGEN
ncbi:MAG: NAD(P)/FAD-dependent oxidoreductase [Oscillospiraceae bacterium]|nr:NAD(P)/FAD-dependent oxidoreductase [Oscillospiraceae bacterium]